MDKQQLYVITLKMLNDKYNINEYPFQKFNNIYTYIYNSYKTTIPNNDINKQILIYIKTEIENTNANTNANKEENFNIETKLKEIEFIRSTLKEETERKLKEVNYNNEYIKEKELKENKELKELKENGNGTSGGVVNIIRMNDNKNDTYKTFVINMNRNELNLTHTDINNKNSNIFPCCICFSKSFLQIKDSPYITLVVKDDIRKFEYYFARVNKTTFKPVIDNYNCMDVGINNQWSISILDFCGNMININEYYYDIIDVLELEDYFSLNIHNHSNFDINDTIKIISELKITTSIVKNKNERIIINKNNLKLQDFKYAKIFNCKYQISVFFKYNSK